MNIIIPLGGKGERFKKKGYIQPKPLIKVLEKEILFYLIDNLTIDYNNDKIFIIYHKDLDQFHFSEIISKKYNYIHLIKLEEDTSGATETIYIGLNEIFKNMIYHKKTILLDCDTFYTCDILTKFRNCEYNAVYYTKNYHIHPIFSYINIDDDNFIFNANKKFFL